MMGCAIGMTLISAIEILYWILIKPIIKVNNNPSPTQKNVLKLVHFFVFAALIGFLVYRFSLVYQLQKSLEE